MERVLPPCWCDITEQPQTADKMKCGEPEPMMRLKLTTIYTN